MNISSLLPRLPPSSYPRSKNPSRPNDRVVYNYKALNTVTVRGHYSLPLILDLLDRLQKAHIFKRVNLCNAYNLMRFKKDHGYLKLPLTPDTENLNTVVPFGFVNIGTIFS